MQSGDPHGSHDSGDAAGPSTNNSGCQQMSHGSILNTKLCGLPTEDMYNVMPTVHNATLAAQLAT